MGEVYWIFFWWGFVPIVVIVLAARGVRRLRKQVHNEVVVPVMQAIEYRQAIAKKRYEDLPELGKARWDKQQAKAGKGLLALVGVGAAVVTTVIFPPLGLPALVVSANWVFRNWKECNDAIKDADERRSKALSA